MEKAPLRIIQCNAGNATLMWKYPFPCVVRGSVIKVQHHQVAALVGNGVLLDVLDPGREVVVDSANLPFLNQLLSAATNNSTYHFEIWYANRTCEHNANWEVNGQADGIYIKDATIGTALKIDAQGQYRYRISDAAVLFNKLVGSQETYATTQVEAMFDSQVRMLVIDKFLEFSEQGSLSVRDMMIQRKKLAENLMVAINKDLNKAYGLELTDFSISRISSDDYDTLLAHQKRGLGLKTELESRGEYYAREREYDILNAAASNPGAGAAMGVGMGMGMGASIGSAIGGMASNAFGDHARVSQQAPRIDSGKKYHYAANGKPNGPLAVADLVAMVTNGEITPDTLVWTAGMAGWSPLSSVDDFSDLIPPALPPELPL